jgi:hypothetical protein
MKKSKDACLVVVVSDTHINSTVGLLNRRINLDDGGQYVSSKSQNWLYNNFLSFCKEIETEKRRLSAPTIVIFNGDIADDNQHKTTQLITGNKADILRMTVDTLNPIIELADHIIVMRGTEAHVGPSASMDEMFADDISADKSAENIFSWWEFRGMIGGVTFDIAHHPGTFSGMPHTAHAPAGKVATRIEYDYAIAGKKPPDIAIRSHNHIFSDSGLSYETRAFITLPWQLTTSYGHRKGFSGRIMPVGGMYFVCEKGKYDVKVRKYSPRRTRYWSTYWTMKDGK